MTDTTEDRAFANRRGKWSQPGVPHQGWRCVDVEDLGSPEQICEMCEARQVRFVHHMEHDHFGKALQVGCICAGHMEQDLAGARRRERTMTSRAGKRARWVRRRWRVSAKGNEWLRADGYRVIVYQAADGRWGATVAADDEDDDGLVRHTRRRFSTISEAKLAAFDFVSRLLAAG
jgi:hypothetical protein